MCWVHRGLLKGLLATISVVVVMVPVAYIIMIPMTFLANFLSSFFAENLQEGAFAGISTFGTGVLAISLFVWYCVTQRHVSGFKSAPANAYRTSDSKYVNLFGRRLIK